MQRGLLLVNNRSLAQPIRWPREVSSRTDDLLRDFQKKDRLLQELRNAEWILDYAKRLAKLRKKTAAQGSKAELRRSLD